MTSEGERRKANLKAFNNLPKRDPREVNALTLASSDMKRVSAQPLEARMSPTSALPSDVSEREGSLYLAQGSLTDTCRETFSLMSTSTPARKKEKRTALAVILEDGIAALPEVQTGCKSILPIPTSVPSDDRQLHEVGDRSAVPASRLVSRKDLIQVVHIKQAITDASSVIESLNLAGLEKDEEVLHGVITNALPGPLCMVMVLNLDSGPTQVFNSRLAEGWKPTYWSCPALVKMEANRHSSVPVVCHPSSSLISDTFCGTMRLAGGMNTESSVASVSQLQMDNTISQADESAGLQPVGAFSFSHEAFDSLAGAIRENLQTMMNEIMVE